MSATTRVGGSDQGPDTLENVATNFMQHVQDTEVENGRLRERLVTMETEERRLKDRLVAMETDERRVTAETRALEQDLTDFTSRHKRVEAENAELLAKVSELKRDKDQQKKVYEDKVTNLEDLVSELERSKAKLNKMLGDMDSSMRQFNQKIESQEAVIADLKKDVPKQEDLQKLKQENAANETEITRLNKAIAEKQETMEKLKNELKSTKTQTDLSDKEEVSRLRDLLQKREKELKSVSDVVGPLEKERSFLNGELSKVKDEVKAKTKEIEDLRRKLDSLQSSKKSLEKTISSLKRDNDSLKQQNSTASSERGDELDSLETKISDLTNKLSLMKTSEYSLAELLRSKENHILDLRAEISELRDTSSHFKKDLEDLRSENDRASVISEKYDDMATNHKRLLDENKRLRTMYATKNVQETSSASENADLRQQLEEANKKVTVAQRRVAQLEGWMDEIFRNQDYDVVLKTGTSDENGRDSVVSLPEVAKSNGKYVNKRQKQKGPTLRTYGVNSLRELPGKY